MFNTRLKKRVKFLEELTEVRGRRLNAMQENQKELMKGIRLLTEKLNNCL